MAAALNDRHQKPPAPQTLLPRSSASPTRWPARQAIPDAVTPDDIANMALYLASDVSQRITRQCFQVDGGLG
jgi:enoyl-[acyl-carrier-protein] reductase (NADH)